MDLMRNLYETGDGEMKRTIAKAWTESQEKQTREELGMPPGKF
jgi:calcyclin binding protein